MVKTESIDIKGKVDDKEWDALRKAADAIIKRFWAEKRTKSESK